MAEAIITTIVPGIIGLFSHAATRHKVLHGVLIGICGLITLICMIASLSLAFNSSFEEYDPNSGFRMVIYFGVAILTFFNQFEFGRKLYSKFFMLLEGLVNFRFFDFKAKKFSLNIFDEKYRTFQPQSIPHFAAYFVYVCAFAFYLGVTEVSGFNAPLLPVAVPQTVLDLFAYNGLALTSVAFMGVGIFVSRNFKQCLDRLGLVKVNNQQILIGIGLIFFTFGYDYVWSLFTHNLAGQDLANKMATFNSGTFTAGGGLHQAVILALATAIFAGIGEETLCRGALLPVFGCVGAGVLHGLMHCQFSNAPIYIIQVSIWSTIIGLVRQRTNTTTTIIGHVGFNFLTAFMIAFNP